MTAFSGRPPVSRRFRQPGFAGLSRFGVTFLDAARILSPMISKLPRWVWGVAWGLSFVAGIVNVVGLMGFEHQAMSHLTGTTSLLAAALAALDGPAVLRFAGVIGSFLAGTVFSGYFIQDSAFRLGRRYGVALLLESLLLCAAVPLLWRESVLGIYFASCACGLQNALVSTYSGTVVRTTHVSGMFTDLGIFLGHSLRGLPVDRRRMRLCFLIISGFLCGGVAGAVAFPHLGYSTLFISAGLAALAALASGLYSIRHRQESG
jgi:uncharacterized membrane protein YoaK (UPF0700 family)